MCPDNSNSWQLITQDSMTLRDYPCGISAGDELRLIRDLRIMSHEGHATGKAYAAGSIEIVLRGNPAEPNTVWLRHADGEQHTWDDESLLEWFEPASHHVE